MDEIQRRATIRLHLADGIGAILIKRLIDHFGDAAAAAAASPATLQRVDGIGPTLAAAVSTVTDEQVDEELAEAERIGVRVLVAGESGYPKALLRIYDYPPVLYVRGRLTAEDAVAFGVVGARRCTHYVSVR